MCWLGHLQVLFLNGEIYKEGKIWMRNWFRSHSTEAICWHQFPCLRFKKLYVICFSFCVWNKNKHWYVKNATYSLVVQFCVWKAVMRTLNGHFLILVVKEMATHSSFLAWEIPWMEEPGGLQPMVSQRVGHDWATSTFSFLSFTTNIHGEIREQVGMDKKPKLSFSSVQFIHSVVSDSLRPYGLQHARPPCPSPTPGVYSHLCPLSRWCCPNCQWYSPNKKP